MSKKIDNMLNRTRILFLIKEELDETSDLYPDDEKMNHTAMIRTDDGSLFELKLTVRKTREA